MALAAFAMALTACSSDNNGSENEGGDEGVTLLKGELTQDITLQTGKTYTLSGGYTVKPGATLYIQEGVTIKAVDDDIVDYILVEQGAKINAVGTAAKPIVMTSDLQKPGAWGGIHICGKAPINVTEAKSEIGDASYGGTLAADNSGVLKYVRVEYAGYTFSEEKEANGFTFYGVGSGTTVEYCQAYKGSDDGFEFFGGTLNVKYLVSTSNSDDSFDWTEGWAGKGQFLVAYQEPQTSLGYDCDCLIEADNNSKNFAITPVSCPTLANVTLIGNGSATGKRGIRLRAGTKAKIYNTLVKGKALNLTTETAETENALVNGSSVLNYMTIEGDIDAKEKIYSSALFTAAANNNQINGSLTFTGTYVGTVDGGKDLSADSFFTAATYQGAVKTGSDWTAGWTK